MKFFDLILDSLVNTAANLVSDLLGHYMKDSFSAFIESRTKYTGVVYKTTVQVDTDAWKPFSVFLNKLNSLRKENVDDISVIYGNGVASFIPNRQFDYNGMTFKFNIMDKIVTMIVTSMTVGTAKIKKFIDELSSDMIVKPLAPNTMLMLERNSFSATSLVTVPYYNNLSFDDVYIENKSTVIRLLDSYMSGKYDRLNILLYGPPGTGKTSTIHAIQKYTEHVPIALNLSSFASIDKLNAILFKDRMTIINSHGIMSLEECYGIGKKLVIFEDFDIDGNLLNVANKSNREKVEMMIESGSMSDGAKGLGITPSQLLNTFDGINKLRNTICVFTTNNPEKINKAFLRKGRMDLVIKLDYPNKQVIAEVIHNKFPEVSDEYINTLPDNCGLADIKASMKMSETAEVFMKELTRSMEEGLDK